VRWGEVDPKHISEVLPIQLSFGCNFRCKFCNFFHKDQCYVKSREAIRGELRAVKGLKTVRLLRFVDDSMPARTLRTICELMAEERIDIPWTTFVRLDSFTGRNIELLKDSNCVDLQVGIESGDDRILKNMNKKVSGGDYLRILEALSRFDISIRASFIVGYPGENEATIRNTIDFLNRIPQGNAARLYVGFAPFILLPLAPVYYESERKPFNLKGYLIDWAHDGMSFSEIPQALETIFLETRDEILFVYTGDPMDFNLPKPEMDAVKRVRQRLQKAIVKKAGSATLSNLRNELQDAVGVLLHTGRAASGLRAR
jgi:p-methyltransferase